MTRSRHRSLVLALATVAAVASCVALLADGSPLATGIEMPRGEPACEIDGAASSERPALAGGGEVPAEARQPSRPSRPAVAPTSDLRAETERESRALAEACGRLRDASEEEAPGLAQQVADLASRLGRSVHADTRAWLIDLIETVRPAELRPLLGEALAAGGPDPALAGRLESLLVRAAGDGPTFAAVCCALVGVGGRASVAALAPHLDASEALRAGAAARAVGRIGGDEAAGALLGALRGSATGDVRSAIESGCLMLPKADWSERAAQEVARSAGESQASLLRLLAERPDPRALTPVLAVVDSTAEESNVRWAIHATAACADPPAGERLARLLQEGGGRADAAEEALHRLSSSGAVVSVARHWSTLRPAGRRALLVAAARLESPTPEVTALAVRALSDSDARIREVAIHALGPRSGADAVPPLAERLRSTESEAERNAVLHALRRIGGRRAADVALQFLAANPDDPGQALAGLFEAEARP